MPARPLVPPRNPPLPALDLPPSGTLVTTGFTVETCGSCRFGVVFDAAELDMRECRGAPPTPTLAGMTPNGPAIILLRPRLKSSEPACSLHKPRVQA